MSTILKLGFKKSFFNKRNEKEARHRKHRLRNVEGMIALESHRILSARLVSDDDPQRMVVGDQDVEGAKVPPAGDTNCGGGRGRFVSPP